MRVRGLRYRDRGRYKTLSDQPLASKDIVGLTTTQSPRNPAADMAPAMMTIGKVIWLLRSPLLAFEASLSRPWSRAVTAESITRGRVAKAETVRGSCSNNGLAHHCCLSLDAIESPDKPCQAASASLSKSSDPPQT